MTTIEVIDSPDLLSIGIYTFRSITFSIGSNLSCDIVIGDKKLKKKSFLFIEDNSQLFFQSLKKHSFILNNKKLKGHFLIKPDNILKIGDTTIKLISFTPTINIETSQIKIEAAYDNIQQSDTKLFEILNEIENIMIRQE